MIKTRLKGIFFASFFVFACQTQVPQKESISNKSSVPTQVSTSPTPNVNNVISPSSEKPKEIVQEPQVSATPTPLQTTSPNTSPIPSATPNTSSSSGSFSNSSGSGSASTVTTGTVSVSFDTKSPVKE